ncbi:MAG: substrate-binding periplasmic protein [Pseudomonadales bacterium]
MLSNARWLPNVLALALIVGSGFAVAAEPLLHLSTEDFPPYSMAKNGSAEAQSADQVTGFAAEIVKELLRRADVSYTLDLIPWTRAYDKALNIENHGVFSTTRTPAREEMFQWVGPIAQNDWVFMAKADSPIVITSIQQASNYRIGGYLNDAIADYLVSQGLSIEYVPNDALNVRKLAKSRIDLWPVVKLKGTWLARKESVPVKPLFTIKRTTLALALNKQTDLVLVRRLNDTLEAMREDGTVEAITASFLTDEEHEQVHPELHGGVHE